MVSPFDDILLKMLAGVPLFRGFGRQELIDLLGLGRKVQYAAHEYVFEEGMPGESMYVVISGSFVVLKKSVAGKPQEIARILPGEHFGEMAIIESQERAASIQAVEASVTLKFHQRDLVQNPPVAMKLYRNIARLLSKRLRKTNEMLVRGSTKARLPDSGGGASPPQGAALPAQRRVTRR